MTRTTALLLLSLLAVPFATLPLAAQAPAKPLTVEAIYAHEPLIGTPPDELTWSPDAKHLTYLMDDELMDMDPATGQAHVLVSRAKLASFNAGPDTEQDRDHRARYDMASYLWAPDSTHLLFDENGRLWLYDLRNGAAWRLARPGRPRATIPSSRPTANPSPSFAITGWLWCG